MRTWRQTLQLKIPSTSSRTSTTFAPACQPPIRQQVTIMPCLCPMVKSAVVVSYDCSGIIECDNVHLTRTIVTTLASVLISILSRPWSTTLADAMVAVHPSSLAVIAWRPKHRFFSSKHCPEHSEAKFWHKNKVCEK